MLFTEKHVYFTSILCCYNDTNYHDKQCVRKHWKLIRYDNVSFLAQLSWGLKYNFMIEMYPKSVVIVPNVVVVVNISHFRLLLKNH